MVKRQLLLLFLFPIAGIIYGEAGTALDPLERAIAGEEEPDESQYSDRSDEQPPADDESDRSIQNKIPQDEAPQNETPQDKIPPSTVKAKLPPGEFRLKNRSLEFAFEVNAGVANNFIAVSDLFFRETAVINFDDLLKGFKFDFVIALTPLSINFNHKDTWGFSLPYISLQTAGNFDIAKNVVGFKQTEKEKFGGGGAVFMDMGIPVFFHVGDVKVKIRPAGFLPLAYTRPAMYYTYRSNAAGTIIRIDSEQRIYSGLLLDDMMPELQRQLDNSDIDFAVLGDIFLSNLETDWQKWLSYWGLDIGLGFEYPYDSDLDIGVEITHLPLYMPKLDNYMQIYGTAEFDSSRIDINDVINNAITGDEIDLSKAYDYTFTFKTGKGSLDKIWRPFKMVFYVNYRPFDTYLLTLIPSAGFALNPLYASIGSFEGGLKARFDFSNMFGFTISMGYEDRMWRNSLDMVLFNLRAFELDLGLVFQAQSFVKSFQGAGAAVNLGIKFGW